MDKPRRFRAFLLGLVCVVAVATAVLITRAAKSHPRGAGQASNQPRAVVKSKLTLPGAESEGGPTAAAEENYANRAYPAAYVPFQLTRQAHTDWKNAKSRANKNRPGIWTLAGPSTANFPDVLTFSGAAYTTSGRVTALAIDPACSNKKCTVWAAAAGGGVWRTDNALSGNGAKWEFLSESFATNAIGTLTYDAARGTLYAGTGEPNASSDSEAGFGIYKSTDRGDTWTKLAGNTSVPAGSGVDCGAPFGVQIAPAYTGPAFDGRAIGAVVVDPNNANVLYVGSTRAVRGISSVSSGGAVSLAPGLPPFGLWKSTDGGANFTLLNYQDVCLNPTLAGSAGIIQASFGSTRGVHAVALDPYLASTVYAAPFPQNNAPPFNTKGGVWRSDDSGANWTQIKNALNPTQTTDRASFAVTAIPGGFTRMYVGVGNSSITAANQARVYRTDDAAHATDASFTDLTAIQQASAAPNQTLNYCGDPAVGGAQCWYDNVVYTPPGKPDVVYIGGSYSYTTAGGRNNGRAFLRSTNAGVTFTDMTWDATTNPTPAGTCCQGNPIAPNGMHPDSHAVVEIPGTNSAIYGSDGGVVRTSGAFADISSQCAARGLTGTNLATCQQLLSAVPTFIYSLNKTLSTLQFQSLSVAADDPKHLQGGTQDNGTFETTGSAVVWPQILYGDGGQSGFHPTNSALRFGSFTGATHDVNFQNGDPTAWVIVGGPIASSEPAQFYSPIIADPVAAGTIFTGAVSVWRTQNWGGDQAFLEANCQEFFVSGANPACGDFVRIGPTNAQNLTASSTPPDYRGTTLAGGNVAAVARGTSDASTLWAATTTGRIFISKNADNATNTAVTFTRIDTLDANAPPRFPSGIFVDPSDPNHAWISYSSYSSLTPATPGHVFSVTFNPAGPSVTFQNLDGSGATAFPDFPATGIAADSNGDLYVSNDWGVMRLPSGSTNWEIAGTGLPQVEVAGLTIVPGARKLYAATHGRSAWQMTLP